MTEVYTLMPGVPRTRPDWSPIAQPEDQHGVIAHTPNPAAYHDAGGRTMLPRGRGNFGASSGFSTRPGIVNIDPTDPVRGTGGITVDLEAVSKTDFARASHAAHGNPIAAWSYASQMQKQAASAPMPAPPPQQPTYPAGFGMPLASAQPPGYIVPHTDFSGGVISEQTGQDQPAAWDPLALNANRFPMSTPGQQTGSRSVRPPEPFVMPQQMQSTWEGQPGAPQQPPQSPVLTGEPYPPPQQPQPQQMVPPQQQGPPLYPSQQQVPPQQQGPPLYPSQQQVPIAGDPTQNAMMQVLSGIMLELREMRNGKEARKDSFEVSGTREAMLAEEDLVKEPAVETAKYGLPFLTPDPSKPTCQVIFDLGVGGRHSKRFHYAVKRGMCLTLVYDTRYEGDQFIPPNTAEDQTIGVQIPKMQLDIRAQVYDFHQRLGCMDLLNFIIMPGQANPGGPPMIDHDMGDLVHDVMTSDGGGEMPQAYPLV